MNRVLQQKFGSTDSLLLAHAQSRQAEAWNRLVRLYGPLVDYWLRAAGLQPADRADVFQEVFQAVATRLGEFRLERPGDTFRGWMRTITGSKIADHFRRVRKSPPAVGGAEAHRRFAELASPSPPEDGPSSEALETGELSRQALAIAQESFEPQSWRAFWRTAIDGLSAVEVAAELKMKPEAVRQAKSRVLRRLKQDFGHLLD